jgi:hypothetical protein
MFDSMFLFFLRATTLISCLRLFIPPIIGLHLLVVMLNVDSMFLSFGATTLVLV